MRNHELKFIDAHCHIDASDFDEDRFDVLRSAYDKGVISIISSALGVKSIQKTLRIIEEIKSNSIPRLYPCFGLEPYELDEKEFQAVVAIIKRNVDVIVGVGEVGLDFYRSRNHKDRNTQIARFKEFVRLAAEIELPLIVHSRSSGKYALNILKEMSAERVLMHAFDGKTRWAKMGVDLGYYFSIPTSVVRSSQKQKLAKMVPLGQLMLETDSPVLAPEKGSRNVPGNLPVVAKKVSEIKGVHIDSVAKAAHKNTSKLFNLNLL